MTAINLGLNGLRGWAVWQNTLTQECHRVYKIGLNLAGGVIREVPIEQSPFAQAEVGTISQPIDGRPEDRKTGEESSSAVEKPPRTQLDLF